MIARLWTKLDRAADQRLGFAATSALAPLTGGGIPAWLLSRFLIAAVLAGSVWLVNERHNARIRADRDAEWNRKLSAEMEAVRKAHREKERETQAKIEAATAKWDGAFKSMADYTAQLEHALDDEKNRPRVLPACPETTIPPKALKALRDKARALK